MFFFSNKTDDYDVTVISIVIFRLKISRTAMREEKV